MGNGMNKVLPGLYVGNFRDAKDTQQLTDNNITHILAIHDKAKKIHEDKEYLCIVASDNSQQQLVQYFPECIEFIHRARLCRGSVLVHCLAGVSRSVTVTAAYIMTVTPLSWREALNCIRGVRNGANPNFGFQKQLQNYQYEELDEARKLIRDKFPETEFEIDHKECLANLLAFQKFVINGSPNKDDGLYPLQYNAYKGNNHNTMSQTGTNKDDDKEEESENYKKGDNSDTKICLATSASTENNIASAQGNHANRNCTVNFDQLSDDIDNQYAKHYHKKVE